MAYTPTTWVTGDTVTATKMNKLEQGVANAGSALICTCSSDGDDYVLDKTVAEIYDAYVAGTPVFIQFFYGTHGTYEDFTSHRWLAPITHIFSYNYANVIRIAVTRATFDYFNNDYNYVPAVSIFGASSSSAYPVFIRTDYVNYASVSTDGGVFD